MVYIEVKPINLVSFIQVMIRMCWLYQRIQIPIELDKLVNKCGIGITSDTMDSANT